MYKSVAHKITVAKVDATNNDVPGEIQGFPTIKLFASGKKAEPIEYNGPRTVEDLAKFIEESGTHKIDGYSLSAGSGAKSAKDAAEDVIAKATEGMPQQAMAATESAKESASETAASVGGKVKSAIKEAAAAAYTAIADTDGDAADHHDEL